MKSTDRSAEPSCTESSMASTDLRADLERHQNGHDTKRLYVLDFCTVCELAWPCDAARALAALDEAEGRVATLVEALEKIRSLHHEEPGGGQGFTQGGGYGIIEPACAQCGTPDEYAVEWPCYEHELATAALDTTPTTSTPNSQGVLR